MEGFSSLEQSHTWPLGQCLGIWTQQEGDSTNVLLLCSPFFIRLLNGYFLLSAYSVRWSLRTHAHLIADSWGRGSNLQGSKKHLTGLSVHPRNGLFRDHKDGDVVVGERFLFPEMQGGSGPDGGLHFVGA